jgi:hypothetical protein
MVEWVLDHLENIILNFKNDEYDLVYINFSKICCKNFASRHNCNVVSIQDVVKNKLCYSLAITTHAGSDTIDFNFNYGVELIASKILFTASMIDHNYCKFVNIKSFNYIVCINEYQKEKFKKIINDNKLFISGSPRQDVRKYDRETAKKIIMRHIGCEIDPDKKTLLWLPTHTKASSVFYFAPVIAKLQDKFNIIIKPHIVVYYDIPGFDNFIRSIIPEIIIINAIDSVKLIPAADFVACDYGGSVFYAILADKNTLLLNACKPELLPKEFAVDVPSNVVRDRIINFYPDEEEKLFAALKDDSIWEAQKEIRAQIRKEFFTENPDPARDISEICRRIVRGEL